jgi:Domain of unknown function (DUF4352)
MTQPPQYQPTSGQPYGAPPPGYPAQEPPKKRKKWPWIVGGLVLLSILGCIGVFTLVIGGTGAALNEMDKNQKGQNAAAGVLGRPTVDGKFEFTVNGMDCGLDKIGSSFLAEDAQGEFCVVSITVKNVADTAETFLDSSQQAVDGKGNTYSVNSGAAIPANGEHSVFLEQINPGNTVRGKLVFDVPEGTKLTAVVLHESSFTAGVKVPLK